jgi:hypothetical protein
MDIHRTLATSKEDALPHEWDNNSIQDLPHRGKRHMRLAGIFFIVAFIFFVVSVGAAGYFFYFGGNSVSVDKIEIDILGPTTIAGGDTVPLSLTITNRNPVAIEDASIEITFPNGTRSADTKLSAYPRYTENLGTIASGETITRSIKAVIFGGEGQALALPISLSFGTSGSNSVFKKTDSYLLAITSTPLSISVGANTETVSGKPLSFTLNVRSNAAVPMDNVVLYGAFPFGFLVTNSSQPLSGSTFSLGTMKPGEVKTLTLTGTLTGQDNEQRAFHFTVGTSKSASDETLAVAYMSQDTTVTITSPFIITSLAINGDTRTDSVIAPGGYQNATISYINTLPTSVTNATIAVTISGSSVDYENIQTTSGFYRSSDHTVIFSRDTDSSLASLAPGASGIGSFTFPTLQAGSLGASPAITFTISVSGTRVGQTNVPETVSASIVKTIKIATVVILSASSLHNSGTINNSGVIPPRSNQATTYSIVLNVRNTGSTIAGATVSTILPGYITYTEVTSGSGTFSFNKASNTVTWDIGGIAQGASAQGIFQVSITPSTSQRGNSPNLTGAVSFSGYDRFAGVQITSYSDPVTTETKGDPGYVPGDAIVQ